MIDLRSIARHLRLPVEQIRLAADLLLQGYQPAFIERYRADETGNLPHSLLWSIKLAMERQQRLEESRTKSLQQLPEGIELDSEAKERLAQADTEVEIDSTMRAFRARRTMQQNAEREGVAGQLLEKLMAYGGPAIDDMVTWTQTELSCEREAAEHALQGCKRLIGSLLAGDSGIAQRLRQIVQRRSNVKIVLTVDQNKPESATVTAEATAATAELGPAVQPHVTDAADDPAEGAQDGSDDTFNDDLAEAHEAEAHEAEIHEAESHEAESHEAEAREGSEEVIASVDDSVEEVAESSEVGEGTPSESVAGEKSAEIATLAPAGPVTKGSIAKKGKRKKSREVKASAKNAAKISPRQRRRRWLISMLQPFNGMDKPLSKLSAYQQLMIGRGRRSQLVNLHLSYDTRPLINIVRDAFVSDRHPLLGWFTAAIEDAMSRTMLNRLEQDAIAELEELAQQHLFEVATEPLREQLQQRPVRGHRILVIDAVGPKTSSVAIIDVKGRVLQTDEITCSAQPQVVTQNVVRLGELAHRFKVTLVALTNGPARRFLVHTLRELVNQSADSGLRWTMVDRGGAEAYAASRIALQELPEHNRRDRATIWIARRLQDPLCEMVKLDASRLRLGSYQRELPAEPLKKLVTETIADCVCLRGIDVLSASMQELMAVPGVGRAQADQIMRAIAQDKIHSRDDLFAAVTDWAEASSRQAIGFLRVFESANTLDATAIHPEDYKLAERLIQNTELVQPPAAPVGWSRPIPPPPVTVTPEPPIRVSAPFAQGLNEPIANETQDAVQSATPVAAEQELASIAPPENALQTEVVAESETADNATADNAIADNVIAQVTAAESGDARESPEPEKAPVTVTASAELQDVAPEYPENVSSTAAPASTIDIEKLARGWQVGRERLRWIASCLLDPFVDNRLTRTPVPMQQTMPTLETLEPGMCLWVVVVGVADFGAFVELGPECSGLIHISRLSPNFVEDPHQCVQVGDLVQAWVVAVDSKKRRVAMTAISPAQREAIEKAEAQRAAQRSAERAESNQRGGRPERGQGSHSRGQSQGSQGQGGQGQGGQGQQRTGGQGQGNGGQGGGQGQRVGQPAGHGNQPGNFSGAGSSGGRGRSGGSQAGGQSGGRGQQRGGPRGGREREGGRGQSSQPIIVTSKKPKAPITKDMVEGTVPLRSFSDLLQFYEHKRTDPPANEVPAPSTPEIQEPIQQPGATE